MYACCDCIYIQFIRYMRLPYLGEMLHRSLTIFLDPHQDSGGLILTHIYLLAGCSLPLWLTPLSALSGSDSVCYSTKLIKSLTTTCL